MTPAWSECPEPRDQARAQRHYSGRYYLVKVKKRAYSQPEGRADFFDAKLA